MLDNKNNPQNQLRYFPDYFPPREFRTTHDLPDGQPCPPYYEGVPWRVVMRIASHTTWCRSALSLASLVTPGAARDQSRAPISPPTARVPHGGTANGNKQ